LYGDILNGVANHSSNESIASLGQGLNDARSIGRIAQRFAQALDCVIESVVKIYKRIRRPDLALQFLPSDHLARLFQKSLEDLERLLLQFDSNALLAHFARAQVHLEVVEPEDCAGWGNTLHGRPTLIPVREIVPRLRLPGLRPGTNLFMLNQLRGIEK
jgi:hypothetical protein